MVSTYTGSPTTNTVDQIRVLLGDTNMSDALLDDTVIQYLVSVWGDPYSAAAAGAEQIAAQFAREVAYSGDGVSIGTDALQDKFTALAAALRAQGKRLGKAAAPYAGGTSLADVQRANEDNDEIGTLFGVGQDDNFRQGSSNQVGSRIRADNPLLFNSNR